MSYILEALKKAQAERQLGATPTIHAPTLDAAATRGAAGTQWKPMALIAGALVIASVAALAWRQQSAPAAPESAASVAAPASAAPIVAPVAAPVSAAAVAAPVPAPVVAVGAAAAPAIAPAPEPQRQGAALPAPSAAPSPAAPPAPPLQAAAEPARPVQPVKPAPAPVAEVAEEPVQLLRELPEPIQRSIPPITMGGYMYSKNPADRLVLIDKILRREGEEVAPGLVLDKLLPKAAIFTFKGYRYRVPY